MKHGTVLSGFGRSLAIVGSAAAALFLLWPHSSAQNADKSIVIDREVLVPGLHGRPNAMARLNNGSLSNCRSLWYCLGRRDRREREVTLEI
jgi:hypothetical protein